MKSLSKNLSIVFVITFTIMLLGVSFEQDAFAQITATDFASDSQSPPIAIDSTAVGTTTTHTATVFFDRTLPKVLDVVDKVTVLMNFETIPGQVCPLSSAPSPTTTALAQNNQISMTLTSPSGTVVNLINDLNYVDPNGITANNGATYTRTGNPGIIFVQFDERTTTVVGADGLIPQASGSIRPEGNLSDFIGDQAYGTWTLTLGDAVPNSTLCYTSMRVGITSSALPTDPTTVKKSGGSSASKHLTKPTFGLSHTTFNPQVDNGFTFNSVKFDIIDNFWTPFDIQTVRIGSLNTFSAKVFAQNQLHVQEFLFGIPAVGEGHNAELGIEVWYDGTGEIEKINVSQKSDVIDVESLIVTHAKSFCQLDDTIQKCDTTRIAMKFLEPLEYDVMALKAIDYKKRVNITYLNDGFDVSGVSLNPMITMMVLGTEKYEGLVKVTQSAKYSDLWVTDDGREFEANQYGSFRFITQPFERIMDPGDPKTRLHSEFVIKLDYELERAIEIMNILCERCSDESYDNIHDIFAYEIPEQYTSKYDNPEIKELLLSESLRAQKLLDE